MRTSPRQAATLPCRLHPHGNNWRTRTRPPAAQHPRRRFLSLAVGTAALPAISRIAWAQSYPTRPITIMVPFAPGGASDVIARNLAERMKVSLGQSVIIENVSGAGGTIGTGRVARASPDGYTLSLGQLLTHVTNGAAYALQYDVVMILSQLLWFQRHRICCSAKRRCRPTISMVSSHG